MFAAIQLYPEWHCAQPPAGPVAYIRYKAKPDIIKINRFTIIILQSYRFFNLTVNLMKDLRYF